MLSHSFHKLFIAEYAVDMRKSFDGLSAEARRQGVDLDAGEAMVFVGRSKRIVKVLAADATGVILIAKRFSMQALKTRIRFLVDPSIRIISPAELSMLLEGKDYEVKRQPKGWEAKRGGSSARQPVRGDPSQPQLLTPGS
jgi:hypothetical protein